MPPGIDILYCEQEVVADETTAVNAVLRADTRCTELLAECKKLEEAQEKGTGEDFTERLNEVSKGCGKFEVFSNLVISKTLCLIIL